MLRVHVSIIALCVVVLVGGTAIAQTLFKKALQDKYEFKSVSCNTCHVQGEKKDKRNEFGQLFADELKEKNVTQRINDAKDSEDDAVKDKVYDEVTKEFLAALKKIEAKKIDNGKTYAELLKTGEVEGVKLPE